MNKFALVSACLFCGFAVALGAFGSHALADVVSPDRLTTWQTASRYLMNHGLALFAIGLLTQLTDINVRTATRLIFSGTLIFTTSLYSLVLFDLSILGALTPIGGVLIISGWLTLLMSIIKHRI